MTIDTNVDTLREMSTMISIATPIRNATQSTAKGLTNRPGQNNCFLNSSIQVSYII